MNFKYFKNENYFLIPFVNDVKDNNEGTFLFSIDNSFNLTNVVFDNNINKLDIFENVYLSLIPTNIKFGKATYQDNSLFIILNQNCKEFEEQIIQNVFSQSLLERFSKLNYSVEFKKNDYFFIKEDGIKRLLTLVNEDDLIDFLDKYNV